MLTCLAAICLTSAVAIDGDTLRVGTAVPDMRLAKAAAEAGLDGLGHGT